MALHLQCANGHQAYVPDCVPACAAIDGAHLAGCPGADLDSLLVCPPGSDCCQKPHHHGQAANACKLMASDPEHNHHELPRSETVDNPDCGLCRPMTVTWYDPGNAPALLHLTG
jgi:hypothetical protein